MRQRNDTGYEQHVMVWPSDEHPDLHPFSVAAGEETDKLDKLLGGFVEVAGEEDPVPKPRRKDATAVADMKEGEPQ